MKTDEAEIKCLPTLRDSFITVSPPELQNTLVWSSWNGPRGLHRSRSSLIASVFTAAAEKPFTEELSSNREDSRRLAGPATPASTPASTPACSAAIWEVALHPEGSGWVGGAVLIFLLIFIGVIMELFGRV